jgi:hypothetical protein
VGVRAKRNLPILLIVLLVHIPAIYPDEKNEGEHIITINIALAQPSKSAKFKFKDLRIEPEEYSETDQIVVFVTVTNMGELSEEQTFILYVDKQAVAQKNATLSSGEEQTLIYILPPDFDIGTHKVTIGDQSGQFKVIPPSKRKPWTFILTCLTIGIMGLTYFLYTRAQEF